MFSQNKRYWPKLQSQLTILHAKFWILWNFIWKKNNITYYDDTAALMLLRGASRQEEVSAEMDSIMQEKDVPAGEDKVGNHLGEEMWPGVLL